MSRGHNTRRRGFTLIEATVATGVIGIGIAALMTAIGSNTRSHGMGKQTTEAVFMAQAIREWTMRLPFTDLDEGDAGNPPGPDGVDPQVFVDDLDDLMGVTYSPPRDAYGVVMPDTADWSQTITLTWRDPDDLDTTVDAGASDTVHVQVDIAHHGQALFTTGWLVINNE